MGLSSAFIYDAVSSTFLPTSACLRDSRVLRVETSYPFRYCSGARPLTERTSIPMLRDTNELPVPALHVVGPDLSQKEQARM
jgi:hypothetical protein